MISEVLLGDLEKLDGLGFDYCELLGLGLSEIAVEGFYDSRRGVEREIVKLHI